jgi:hypothetical protein
LLAVERSAASAVLLFFEVRFLAVAVESPESAAPVPAVAFFLDFEVLAFGESRWHRRRFAKCL